MAGARAQERAEATLLAVDRRRRGRRHRLPAGWHLRR